MPEPDTEPDHTPVVIQGTAVLHATTQAEEAGPDGGDRPSTSE